MEETIPEGNQAPGDEQALPSSQMSSKNKKEKAAKPEVIIVRNWKEYLGESFLIIFSVILALILTEIFNKIHEDHQTSQVLHQLRLELSDNKNLETEQYLYHKQVLKNIDSALNNPSFVQKFIKNGEKDLTIIAPFGVLRHDLNNIAWEVAKQNNVFSKLDISTYGLLTDIYDNQQRITKSEDEIGKVLLSWESRKPENLKTTLILMRDNYHGWAVDRAPNLLQNYQLAIDKLSDY